MKTPAPLRGPWRIVQMELWDDDFLDLVAPAHITFEDEGLGSFAFGCVQGSTDCRFGTENGLPLVEFSWEGSDEMDPASGRGWALLTTNTQLEGRLFFHCGDESDFCAHRTAPMASKPRKRKSSRK
jgi:hypothetical protein